MRVALDLHHLGRSDRARLAHPADVVPPEVEEHHVLGSLLLVGSKLRLERRVLLAGRAAAAGPGDRVRRDDALLDADEHLRRGADDVAVAEVEVVHVGRGVHGPERAVDAEGRAPSSGARAAARGRPG